MLDRLDPLLSLTPVFALALIVEGWWARYSARALISALGCAVLDQLTAAWGLAVFAAGFSAIHAASPLALPADSIATWVIAVIGHDLAYYAFHRASHRVTLLWAAHVVHHQSERYDFTVSLRQGSIATWFTYVFYLPLAVVVDARAFVAVHAAYLLFQFLVHTRAISTLGPLEWLLATPQHHRVHHGSERHHLDRNYGGFFIVFDRLLGTFAPPPIAREPRYGVPGGFAIASPVVANTYMFARLVAASAGKPLGARLRLWFAPPEVTAPLVSSAGHPPRVVERAAFRRTWLPFCAGFAGAATVVLADLPTGVAIVVGVTSVALLEIAAATLDGR